ncbi:MAG: hypothetical protein IPM54_25115 [Polyangiaceae bacterium]|nr:hypothetical protein [Polyangiaceae bacterium]
MKSRKRFAGVAMTLVLLGATAAACVPAFEPTRTALTIVKPPPPPPPPPPEAQEFGE